MKRYTINTTESEIQKDVLDFVAPVYRKDRLISKLPSMKTPKRKRDEGFQTSRMKYWNQPKVIARLALSSPSSSSSSMSSSSSSSSSSPRRLKKRWTPEEVALLRKEVSEKAYRNGTVSWATVAKKFPIRTGTDCRDKMRNLMKPGKKLQF